MKIPRYRISFNHKMTFFAKHCCTRNITTRPNSNTAWLFTVDYHKMHYVCQFRVKLGKNRGYPYWISTPNEKVLSFQVLDGCAKFRRNRFKIATVRARTHTHTHTHIQTPLLVIHSLVYVPSQHGVTVNMINKVAPHWAWSLLKLVTACRQVNHLGM